MCRDVLSRLVSIFGTPPFMYLLLFQNKDESFVFGNFYFIFWRQAESFLETFDVRSRQPGFISVNAQFLPIYLQFYITVFFCPTGNGNHYFAIFHKRGCQNVIASCLHWIVGYPIAHHAAVFYAECIPHLPEL